MKSLSGLLLVLALSSAPASAFAADDPPAKPQSAAPDDEVIVRYPPPSARWKVILTGSAMTALSYGGMAIMGAVWDTVPGADMLFIPVAGPWIALGQSGCAPEEETSPGEGDCEAMIGVRAAIFIVDALVQAGGLAVIGEGIFMTTAEPDAPAKATVLPMPIVTEHAIGLGVVGTF